MNFETPANVLNTSGDALPIFLSNSKLNIACFLVLTRFQTERFKARQERTNNSKKHKLILNARTSCTPSSFASIDLDQKSSAVRVMQCKISLNVSNAVELIFISS